MGLLASPLVVNISLGRLILRGFRARLRALCLGLRASPSPDPRSSGVMGYVLTSVMVLNCTVVVVGEAEGAVPLKLLITGAEMSTSMDDMMRTVRFTKKG